MVEHAHLVSRNVAVCGGDRTVALELSEDITRNRIGDEQIGPGSLVRVSGRHLAGIVCELGVTDIEVLKMDIEGAELEVIDSLDDEFLRNISQITIEFHDFLGVRHYPRSFRKNRAIKKHRILGVVLEPPAKHRRCSVGKPASHGAGPLLVRAASHPQIEGVCTSVAASAVKSTGADLNLCR